MNTNTTQTVDERCADLALAAVYLAQIAAHHRAQAEWLRANGFAHLRLNSQASLDERAIAGMANRIIALRTAEAAQAEDAARLNWEAGDTLEIYAHESEHGKGLTYPAMLVTALESGFAGGCDVYDGHAANLGDVSFYGFSVRSAHEVQS